MPRSSGVYAKPAGTTAVPNTVIDSSDFNTLVDDIVADLNAARPISAGGTGATNAVDALANLGALAAGDSAEANNRFILPSGTRVQWYSSGPIGGGLNATIPHPTTFPNAAFAAFTTYANTGSDSTAGNVFIGQVRGLTASNITVRNLGPSGALFFVLVIGN